MWIEAPKPKKTIDASGDQTRCDLERAAFLNAIRAGRDFGAYHEDARTSAWIIFWTEESP